MVDILLYWFRLAEASRKCHMVQMNKYLKKKSAKNPPHSFHVVAMHPKRQAWARESLPTALVHSKTCPLLPGGCLAPAGSLGLHCCACPLGLAFSLCY